MVWAGWPPLGQSCRRGGHSTKDGNRDFDCVGVYLRAELLPERLQTRDDRWTLKSMNDRPLLPLGIEDLFWPLRVRSWNSGNPYATRLT